MTEKKAEFIVMLYDGARAVGVHRTPSLAKAEKIVQDWNAAGENHRAICEPVEVVQAERIDPIAPENYLTQHF